MTPIVAADIRRLRDRGLRGGVLLREFGGTSPLPPRRERRLANEWLAELAEWEVPQQARLRKAKDSYNSLPNVLPHRKDCKRWTELAEDHAWIQLPVWAPSRSTGKAPEGGRLLAELPLPKSSDLDAKDRSLLAEYRQLLGAGVEKSKPVPSDWPQRRLRLIKSEGHTCLRCRRRLAARRLDVVHLVPREDGGSDAKTNLAVLCNVKRRDGGWQKGCSEWVQGAIRRGRLKPTRSAVAGSLSGGS